MKYMTFLSEQMRSKLIACWIVHDSAICESISTYQRGLIFHSDTKFKCTITFSTQNGLWFQVTQNEAGESLLSAYVFWRTSARNDSLTVAMYGGISEIIFLKSFAYSIGAAIDFLASVPQKSQNMTEDFHRLYIHESKWTVDIPFWLPWSIFWSALIRLGCQLPKRTDNIWNGCWKSHLDPFWPIEHSLLSLRFVFGHQNVCHSVEIPARVVLK